MELTIMKQVCSRYDCTNSFVQPFTCWWLFVWKWLNTLQPCNFVHGLHQCIFEFQSCLLPSVHGFWVLVDGTFIWVLFMQKQLYILPDDVFLSNMLGYKPSHDFLSQSIPYYCVYAFWLLSVLLSNKSWFPIAVFISLLLILLFIVGGTGPDVCQYCWPGYYCPDQGMKYPLDKCAPGW